MRGRIAGVGSYLPPRIVSNEEVGQLARIRAKRIEELFDVRERHWVRGAESAAPDEGQCCSDLGAAAARNAIRNAGVAMDAIDTIITVSTTPDVMIPSLDYIVAAKLGLRDTFCADIRGACAGVFRAVSLVEGLIASGRSKCALIVAAETMSPFFRFGPDVPKDHRLNTVLYADGAGAIVVVATDDDSRGIEMVALSTTGDPSPPGVSVRGVLSATPPTATRFADMDYLGHHDFRAVLAKGSDLTWRSATRVFEAMGTSVDDYKFLLTHQATGHMHGIGARYGVPPEKLPTNIDHVGNTVSASILILLDELNQAGRLDVGDRLLLGTAESSTWTYGSMSLIWG